MRLKARDYLFSASMGICIQRPDTINSPVNGFTLSGDVVKI